jgi:hypothetical protein
LRSSGWTTEPRGGRSGAPLFCFPLRKVFSEEWDTPNIPFL